LIQLISVHNCTVIVRFVTFTCNLFGAHCGITNRFLVLAQLFLLPEFLFCEITTAVAAYRKYATFQRHLRQQETNHPLYPSRKRRISVYCTFSYPETILLPTEWDLFWHLAADKRFGFIRAHSILRRIRIISVNFCSN